MQRKNTLVPTDDVPGRFAHLPPKGLELKRIPCAKEKHFGSKGRRTRKVCKPSPKRFGIKTDSVCKAKKLWFACFASRGMQKPIVYMRVFSWLFAPRNFRTANQAILRLLNVQRNAEAHCSYAIFSSCFFAKIQSV